MGIYTKNTFFRRRQIEFLRSAIREKNIILAYAESGIGKTTLVLEFVKKENLNFLYVELNESLQDIGGLISYLNELVKQVNSDHKLPFLNFELLPSVEQFIKSYVKELINSIPEGFFIIFDNFEKIGKKEIVISFFIELIKEIPQKKSLMILSKEEFPFGFFTWDVEERILRLDNSFFRLTKEEIRKFINERENKDLTEEELEDIYNNTHGVIGKLILLNDLNFKNVCENLLTKILQYISFGDLKLLFKVSHLPFINESLLNTYKEKQKILSIVETLCLENFFVIKDETGYKIHDILKEFLYLKAKESKSYEKLLEKQVHILIKNGFVDEAAKILIKEEKIKKVIQILEENIFHYIHVGKFYTLKKYITIIEKSGYKLSPTFLFIKGYLLKIDNPYESIKLLEEALRKFKKENNHQGEKLVIGELFDLVQFYGEDFKLGGKYLKRAEKLIKNTNGIFSDIDIRLLSYLGIIYLLYKGDSKKSEFYFDLINNFTKDAKDLPIFFSYVKLYAAISYLAAGETAKAERNFHEASLIFKSHHPNPNDIFMFEFLASIYEVFIGKFKSAANRGKFLINHSEKWGNILHEEHIISRIVEGLLCAGEIQESKKFLSKVENFKYRTTFSSATTYQLEAQLHLIEKRFDFSLEKAKKSIELFKKVNGKPFEMATKSLLALVYIEKGEFKKAKKILFNILRWAENKKAILQKFTSLIHLVYLYYKINNKTYLVKTLKKAFALGKTKDLFAIYNQYPYIASVIVGLALKYGIEREYAKEWIRRYDLEPPEDINVYDDWDWKIRIYTLGKFKIIVDGVELSEQNINGSKPIELLKAIISQKGEAVSIYRIIDILWDEYDYIKAKQNLEFNLRKLRNILNDKEKNIVILKHNKISLNRKYIWIDLWKFEELYSDLMSLVYKNKVDKDFLNTELKKLKSLYKGKFLEGDYDLWVEDLREDIERKYNYLIKLAN